MPRASYDQLYRPGGQLWSGVTIGDPAQFGRPFADGGYYWCHMTSSSPFSDGTQGRSWAIIMCDGTGNYLYDAPGLRRRDAQAHAVARRAFLDVERRIHEDMGLLYTPTRSLWQTSPPSPWGAAPPPVFVSPLTPDPHTSIDPCDVPGAAWVAYDEDGGDGAGDGAYPCSPDYSSLIPVGTGIRNVHAATDEDRRVCHRASVGIGAYEAVVNTWLRIGYLHHQGGPVTGGDPAIQAAKTVLDIALAIIGCCTGQVGLLQYALSDVVSTWWAYATADQSAAMAAWAKLRAAAGRSGGDATKEGWSGEVTTDTRHLIPPGVLAYAAQLQDRYSVPHVSRIDRSTLIRHATAAGLSAAAILALAALVL